ncbi:Protein FdrA [Ruegeria sp. THAF57]|uniref:protein FdrA n=1 Tax=Ruegeria sp. THAF57 TaxID=2744555 RepID=UPI0015DF02A7|nr:protein FdrA [Ruegeria sp. THAF57]CAD0186823.1 Protein FdrA [Ruegeria sp. THAF57]
MPSLVSVHQNSYKDSVKLLEATRALLSADGVQWGWAFMATPANVETAAQEGASDGLENAGANDLVLAVRADDDDAAKAALETASGILFEATSAADGDEEKIAPDLASAVKEQADSNLAIVSVPGAYATLEAHKALSAGLNVLLFSDNVPLEDEVALKKRAQELGLLVMGPGAGTAMLGGTGLAFANRVNKGSVGVLSAAGTGAQEVMSLLDRWGIGVSHVIGLGGRDLSPEVGGLMAQSAIKALDADPDTKTILLVSKPPSKDVAEMLVNLPKKPMVAAYIGLQDKIPAPLHIKVCNTLEQGVRDTLPFHGVTPPEIVGDLPARLDKTIDGMDAGRTRLSGLYSGGTLCYEAMTIATQRIGPIHSNIPLNKSWTLDSAAPDAHVFLDLGEEEYTDGRPHPMIDTEARIEFMRKQIGDTSLAAVLLDVVIGDGAHDDPASVLAPVAGEIVASGVPVVVYVLGTDSDPQAFDRQRKTFEDAGCIVTETAARAALAACALVQRDSSIVSEDLATPLQTTNTEHPAFANLGASG